MVRSLRDSVAAISRLLRPRATRRNTSTSRGVRWAGAGVGGGGGATVSEAADAVGAGKRGPRFQWDEERARLVQRRPRAVAVAARHMQLSQRQQGEGALVRRGA